MPEIIIKPGREKSIIRHHPWIFSGAISKIIGDPHPGETVDVLSIKGEFLAKAAINQHSNITARIWTWDENVEVDPGFLEARLQNAIASRNKMMNFFNTNAMRLVHGESDGIPGLILDQYDDIAVVQFLTAGVEYWKEEINEIILKLIGIKVLFERSDVDVRRLEGLEPKIGLLHGKYAGEKIIINENGVDFYIDIINGHKTGFYLDQRENRTIVRQLSADRKVLDCFCYTGGFTINCALGDAESVTMVDSSSTALAGAFENLSLNNISLDNIKLIEDDSFKYLRFIRDKGDSFDMVILDPPKFAPTVSQVQHATRGYKDINLLALKLLRPGGFLITFSCSGGVNEDLFQKIITGAALDAGVEAIIVKRLHQASDHPVKLNFPEGAYLKGFVIQKMS